MNKIKEEQLERIKQQQKELTDVIYEIGVLETNKHGLLHRIGDINAAVDVIKKELETEYGAVNINIETGEYTEIVNEDPQSVNSELKVVEDAK